MIFMADCVVRSDTPSPISAERVSRIPPPDDDAHEDGLFVHELTVVNNLLGRYVIRYLDVDAGRAESITTDEERTLAARVAAVAVGLRARAARRDRRGSPRHLRDDGADPNPLD